MKTVKQWLEQLPDGYRERALENLVQDGREKNSVGLIYLAIHRAFTWQETKEGFSFWAAVYSHYAAKSVPLPQLAPLPPPPSKPLPYRLILAMLGVLVAAAGFFMDLQYFVGFGTAIVSFAIFFKIEKA
jgi:hypothetical protein